MNQAFIQQIINHKINHISVNELIRLAAEYGMPISKTEAQQVLTILRSEKINLSDHQQINRLLSNIKATVNVDAMKKAEQLLHNYMYK